MTIFNAVVRLKGANDKVSTMRLTLMDISGADVGAEFLSAVGVMNDFITELGPVTDATIVDYSLSHSVAVDGSAGAGDLFEKALVILRIPTAEVPDKVTNFYVPAPAIGIFENTVGVGRDIVDITDADLIALVGELVTGFTVSDGDSVDSGITNGIAGGRRVVTKMKLGGS